MKLQILTVIGKGQFPLDMLRHEGCYPSNSQTVNNIGLSLLSYTNPNEEREYRLAKVTNTKEVQYALGRWISFGFRAKEDVKVITIYE